jgi:hypothetical protein
MERKSKNRVLAYQRWLHEKFDTKPCKYVFIGEDDRCEEDTLTTKKKCEYAKTKQGFIDYNLRLTCSLKNFDEGSQKYWLEYSFSDKRYAKLVLTKEGVLKNLDKVSDEELEECRKVYEEEVEKAIKRISRYYDRYKDKIWVRTYWTER